MQDGGYKAGGNQYLSSQIRLQWTTIIKNHIICNNLTEIC